MTTSTRRISGLLCAALFGFAGAQIATAATQEEIDEALRVKSLEEARKAAAEARKAVAEAQAAEAKARLGTLDLSKLSAPTGEAKTLNVEGAILAHSALEKVARTVAKDVASTGKAPVALVSTQELDALQQISPFRAGVDQLSAAMTRLRVPALAADRADCSEPAVVGGVAPLDGLQALLQVFQLFKVDRKYEGADVTLTDFAVAASVARHLRAFGVERVIYPSLVAGPALGPPPGGSELAKSIDALVSGQRNAEVVLAEVSRRRAAIAAREAAGKDKLPPACPPAFEEAREIYTRLETGARSLKERADGLVASATATDDKGSPTLLRTLYKAEALAGQLGGARILHVAPVAGGGTTYTRTSLFSTRIGVGGGAIVAYMLIDAGTGNVALSGTVPDYGGFVEPEGITEHLAKGSAGRAGTGGMP